jgi:predicted MPP superfamily phosphohydrolase
VNNVTEEMLPYKEIFSRLKSKHGVLSTTGNHDYGDYSPWPTPEAKKENFKHFIKTHADMGWDLLMNENRILERDGQKIAIIGIENWGNALHFPKYGKLDVAYKGTEDIPFKILMSHDPSHWDAEVRPKYPDIDLALAGHTHGFQFGIENKYIKWSPSEWVYKQWAGLYQEGKQYIYVNRGFGFLGYPGRVGILPEITEITLRKG